jgi:hypothetical protein
MGAVPTVYRWDDAGAPSNPASNNAYDRSALVGQILKTCLVDGYGAKAAAGWVAHDVAWPTSSQNGRIIFENASQSGVAEFVMQGASARVQAVAAGWDGSSLVDAVPYQYTSSGDFTYLVGDARSQRWCLIANDRACVLLVWRDSAGLTGEGMSLWNGVAFMMGECVPIVPTFSAGAAPNFVGWQCRRLGDPLESPIGDNGLQSQPVVSRITAAGVANTYSGDDGFNVQAFRFDNYSNDLIFPAAATVPAVPFYLSEANPVSVFARWPGLWISIGIPGNELLSNDRDVRGQWTGTPVTVDGEDRVLVVSNKAYGWVSLASEAWP